MTPPSHNEVSLEIMKGKAHHLRGEIQDALYWYRQSVLKHPTCSLSYFHLGEALLALNKLPAALKAYCKGLACHYTIKKIDFSPPTGEFKGQQFESIREGFRVIKKSMSAVN
jgi:tetratricopeptide (TPR) repeat protein